MKHSESISKLSAALSLAQAEMPEVAKNAVNPFLKNRFADLGAVIQASRPVLAKHGLSISQFPTSDGTRVGVTSILMHSSGEWLEDTIALELSEEKGKSAAQVAGSIVTYLRRYSWASMLGMYADEDTDGSQPQKIETKKEMPEAERQQAVLTAWAELIKRAQAVGESYEPLNPKMTSAEMKAAYAELKARVVKKEEAHV